jgi:hypothetical protein
MFRPGKGIFMPLNEEMIDWFKETMEVIWDAAGGAGELNTLIDEGGPGLKKFLATVRGSSTGWKTEQDNFGIKLYRELAWADNAMGNSTSYRITLVITKRDDKLRLDIREWFDDHS